MQWVDRHVKMFNKAWKLGKCCNPSQKNSPQHTDNVESPLINRTTPLPSVSTRQFLQPISSYACYGHRQILLIQNSLCMSIQKRYSLRQFLLSISRVQPNLSEPEKPLYFSTINLLIQTRYAMNTQCLTNGPVQNLLTQIISAINVQYVTKCT